MFLSDLPESPVSLNSTLENSASNTEENLSSSTASTAPTATQKLSGSQIAKNIPKIRLNNGIKVPNICFGTYTLHGDECIETVTKALDAGYRYFDTAEIYENERELSKALRESGLARNEYVVQSKIWVDGCLSEDVARTRFLQSLHDLGLDYIDIYLIHFPYGDVFATWRALEKLYNEGLVKAIGVSNFSNMEVENLSFFNQIKPVLNQLECHPFYQREPEGIYLGENDILLQAWSPLTRNRTDILEIPVIQELSQIYNKTPAQIVLSYLVQLGTVPIVKSSNPERMSQNLDIFDINFTDEEFEMLKGLDDNNFRLIDQSDPANIGRFFSGRADIEQYRDCKYPPLISKYSEDLDD